MECTGERYLPEFDGDWSLEHTHRYLVAREFADGKVVLDIACGEGYGSRMLADIAQCVIGVDISLKTVTQATIKYPHAQVFFVQGEATRIPLMDNSVDLVVSFETIEHLGEQDRMIQEIRRVLRPEGLCIISSPDKREYSDLTGYTNVYHVKELYYAEFISLLKKEFKQIQMVGQRMVFGSLMGAENDGVFFFLAER